MTDPFGRETPTTGDVRDLAITTNDDVVRVRQAVREAAQRIRLSLVDQTKLVTAASELARNTLVHGRGGGAELETVRSGRRVGIRVCFSDDGPGIPDVELALTDGWTSGNGMGLGLGGARRLVDDFALDTTVGRGTRVEIVKWSR